VRLFVAAELSGAVRARLGELQQRLRPQVEGAKWGAMETMHLTFKFIGEMEEARIPSLRAALGRSLPADDVPPFTLHVRGLGVFPDRKRPRVLWAGLVCPVAGAPERLQRRLDEAASEAGCPRETRPFHPHLTLARLGETRAGRLDSILSAARDEDFGSFDVPSVWLFQSVLKPSGAEHRKLEEYRLA
jgi:RNA 2',3'-cyclic 3'-phosphodiesterase